MTKHLIGTFMTVAGLVALALAGTLTVSAQEATPEGTQSEAHPAHIHSGTCAELGDVVHPLEDVTGGHLEGTPAATPEAADEGLPGDVIAHSRTSVEANLDDLLSEEHAVNVHESADNIDVFIACANIEGEPEDGELYLELQQQNDSGVAGQVILSETGDGTIEVTITLTDASAEQAGQTAEATPAD